MLEVLDCRLRRNGKMLSIELAESLCLNNDEAWIDEIVGLFKG